MDDIIRGQLASLAHHITRATDGIVLVLHLYMQNRGQNLCSISEDGKDDLNGTLPDGWNQSGDVYCLKYRLSSGSFVVFKALVIDNMMFIHCAPSAGELITTELSVFDYINQQDVLDIGSLWTDLHSLLVLIDTKIGQRIIPAEPEEMQPQYDNRPLGFHNPQPAAYDPLRIGNPRRPGDFERDLRPVFQPEPFGHGGDQGNIMGPQHPMFRGQRGDQPRFDPFGPGGMGPDHDHMQAPRRSGPYRDGRNRDFFGFH